MKMPEPVAKVSDLGIVKYNQLRHGNGAWAGPYKDDDNLYDKQALIDLLEEAAKECEKEWSTGAERQYGEICARSIRDMKETL